MSQKINNHNPHILVCDDCEVTCFLLQTILETNGYQVTTVLSGEEVLQEIASQTFDLLLLDVTMPGMDGYEVADRIQQNRSCKCLPILLLSGYEEDTIKKKCQANVAGIIRKPVDMNVLLAVVKQALQLCNCHHISVA
ncbi:response regulator [Nostoc sp. FACHB-87]|uniref:response regulator n=1 Tax=Nostocaceae TaxID=1162 RepID=UPI001687BA22|nr:MULTISPECIES: response regulator [Nostocaceae]MBD2453906.1 response regulator [Nostoc sp. FACHB-87]MBD2476029.1 response regulator [Anabaena sp. FACHB-83]